MKHPNNLRCYGIIVSLCYFVVIVNSHQYCPLPDVPAEGEYKPKSNKFLPGDKVTYTCRDGFTLLGRESRTCNSSGDWSNRTPFCDRLSKLKVKKWFAGLWIFESVDDYTGSCLSISKLCPTSCYQELQLEKQILIHTIMIFLKAVSDIKKIQIQTGVDNNMKVCADYERYSETSQWIVVKCNYVLSDKIEIRRPALSSSDINICKIQVFGGDELGCEHPPEIRVPNGYFEVSRYNATLICEDGYESKNNNFVCEKKSWKGVVPRCDETMKTSYIIIGVTGAAAVIIILILFRIYLISKKKNREALAAYMKTDVTATLGSESEYAIPYYESELPNVPSSPRPTALPPVLSDGYSLPEDYAQTEIREPVPEDGYSLPEDCKETEIREPVPSDIVSGTLKKSTLNETLYGN